MMNVSAFGSAYIFLFVGWGRVDGVWGDWEPALPEKQQSQKLFHLRLHGIFSHESSAGESLFAR